MKEKEKKNQKVKQLFAVNHVAGNIIRQNQNKVVDEVYKNVEPFLKGGPAIALSIGAYYGKKEHENIKKFQKNKNRGKKIEPKKLEQNTVQVESTKALSNSKKFTK